MKCYDSYVLQWKPGQEFDLLDAMKREAQINELNLHSHEYTRDKTCWHCTIALLRWYLYVQEYKKWPLWG